MVKSVCRMCHGGCGARVYVEGGRAVKVEGDPEHPVSRGYMCAKGAASIEVAYHPDRLRHPLKRAGGRGEGKWERVTWDRALSEVASRLLEIKRDYGPESVVFAHGTNREYLHMVYRLANAFGTPNVTSPGYVCYLPRVVASILTCGGLPIADYDGGPRCVVVWGCNPLDTSPDEYCAAQVARALREGPRLIVVDPRPTELAKRADLWIKLRPGTDAALALGMINVIIEEGLYDSQFVEGWTVGFKELAERAAQYPPSKVEEITWVPADLVREAARLYATTKPACIHWGVKIEQSPNCTSCVRALVALMAITGNLDAPGGNVLYKAPPVTRFTEFMMSKALPEEVARKRLGGHHKLSSIGSVVPPMYVVKAILEGDPYPVKALVVFGSNPLLTWPNSRRVREALMRLDLLVVVDLFMTPTAELADYVLPAATWLEVDDVAFYFFRAGYVMARRKAVDVEECWPDHKIVIELAKRLGLREFFWDDVEGYLNYVLAPSGLTWREFAERGWLEAPKRYRKYLEEGFGTPSRKVELYSKRLEEWGFDPLPNYVEPPESPVSRPDLAREYPIILTTGARSPYFFHSEHRQAPSLRRLQPDPIVELGPETARRCGVEDGRWAWIETPRGRVRMRVRVLPGMLEGVASAQHAWWFPERPGPDHGCFESNVNVLTSDEPPLDPCFGAANFVSMLCRIYPAD
ncbi:MAG: molybdopterin-dependent oxidoreductase [Candidatus Nezhaarchaeales archaeon]